MCVAEAKSNHLMNIKALFSKINWTSDKIRRHTERESHCIKLEAGKTNLWEGEVPDF